MTGLARSTFYYQSHAPAAQSVRDATLSERMQALALVFPRPRHRPRRNKCTSGTVNAKRPGRRAFL
jgi:hypothetical protein